MDKHAFFLVLALLAGCGGPPPAAVPARPSPTIAALMPAASATAALQVAPAPAPARPAPSVVPAPTSPPAPLAVEPAGAAQFSYLWPAYLPAGMEPTPAESRVARVGETGAGGVGFFIVTFSGGAGKLVIGGGAVEPFSMSGPAERIVLGGRAARVSSEGDQIQIVVDDGVPGSLFVFGIGLGRAELVRVAESLAPLDLGELRRRVGVDE